jgi:hypothetical protein
MQSIERLIRKNPRPIGKVTIKMQNTKPKPNIIPGHDAVLTPLQ